MNLNDKHHEGSCPSKPKEILLADASVEQLDVLLAGLRSHVDVQLISPHDDAVSSLAQALATPHLDTLHVLGHGAPGEVTLGAKKLTPMPCRS